MVNTVGPESRVHGSPGGKKTTFDGVFQEGRETRKKKEEPHGEGGLKRKEARRRFLNKRGQGEKQQRKGTACQRE